MLLSSGPAEGGEPSFGLRTGELPTQVFNGGFLLPSPFDASELSSALGTQGLGVSRLLGSSREQGKRDRNGAAAPLLPPCQTGGVGYFRHSRTRLGVALRSHQWRARCPVPGSRGALLTVRLPLGAKDPPPTPNPTRASVHRTRTSGGTSLTRAVSPRAAQRLAHARREGRDPRALPRPTGARGRRTARTMEGVDGCGHAAHHTFAS